MASIFKVLATISFQLMYCSRQNANPVIVNANDSNFLILIPYLEMFLALLYFCLHGISLKFLYRTTHFPSIE